MKKTIDEILRYEIDKELEAIQKISEKIRLSTMYAGSHREFDAAARDIKSHSDRIKDLSYELGKFGVKS